MIKFHLDLADFNGDMEYFVAHHERGLDKGLDRVAQIGLQAKLRQVRKTYARKIPLSNTGAALWKRTGAWLQGQRILNISRVERHIVTEGNAEKYEGRLANLNTGADGINRTNAATEAAAVVIEPQCGSAFAAEYAAVQRIGK